VDEELVVEVKAEGIREPTTCLVAREETLRVSPFFPVAECRATWQTLHRWRLRFGAGARAHANALEAYIGMAEELTSSHRSYGRA
jgi:hypothetical protein